MAIEKSFQTRIIHKHDIEDNWNKATNFKPNKGEMIVYDKDDNHNFVRLKFGDGETVVKDLPFIQTSSSDARDIYNPNKTYFIYGGTNVPSSNAAGEEWIFNAGAVIDWGDGKSQTTIADTVNSHTYTDGVDYHLISISHLTTLPSLSLYGDFGISEAYIGTDAPYMTIGTSAFEGATLKKITLSDKVTSIGGMAFSSCGYLKTVILEGATPPTLGADVFRTAQELLKIFVPKTAVSAYQTATNWSVYADKIVYEIDSSDLDGFVQDPHPGQNDTGATLAIVKNAETPNWVTAFKRNSAELVQNAGAFDFVGYGDNGEIYAKTTTNSDYSVVNKKYVDDNFIPFKEITSGDFQIPQVGYNKELFWVAVNTYVSPISVAQRSENGQVRVADPVRDDDAVSKQYFEQHKADLARYVSTSLLGD